MLLMQESKGKVVCFPCFENFCFLQLDDVRNMETSNLILTTVMPGIYRVLAWEITGEGA